MHHEDPQRLQVGPDARRAALSPRAIAERLFEKGVLGSKLCEASIHVAVSSR
jgi:hypothetical protein